MKNTDLISRAALLAELRQMEADARAGEARNPEDSEWTAIADCYGDAIRKVEALPAIAAPAPSSSPYSPELAESFRQGAREMQIDALDVAPDAIVEESEGGGGAYVRCRIFVSDRERLPMEGEEDWDRCPSHWSTDRRHELDERGRCKACLGFIGHKEGAEPA